MRKRLITSMAALASSACAVLTCAAAAESVDDTAARGKGIVAVNCGPCHAIGADDQSSHPEAPPFRVVVTRYPPENLAEALAEGIVSGHPDMPEFVFQPPEIEAILAYLATLEPAAEAVPEKSN